MEAGSQSIHGIVLFVLFRDTDSREETMRTGEEEKTESTGRLYRGCENCGHYTGRVCRITGEELTMVCEKWEEVVDEDQKMEKE